MDSPNPRWDLERAVLAARIPSAGKLVMLTLLTKAGSSSLDLGRWSPGTRSLAEQTSLKTDTVTRFLGLLEQHGWLALRKRKGLRTEYVLSAGRPFRALEGGRKVPRGVPARGHSRPVGVPRGGDSSVPPGGDGGVPIRGDGGVPPGGDTFRPSDRRSDRSDHDEPDPFDGLEPGNGQARHGFKTDHTPLPPSRPAEPPDPFEGIFELDQAMRRAEQS